MADTNNKALRVALLAKKFTAKWKLDALQSAQEKGIIKVVAIICSRSYWDDDHYFMQRFSKTEINKNIRIDSVFNNVMQIEQGDLTRQKDIQADLIFSCLDNDLYSDEEFKFTKYGIWMFSFVHDSKLVSQKEAIFLPSKNLNFALLVNCKIVREGKFRILKHSWKKTLNNLYTEAEGWLAYACNLVNQNIPLTDGEHISETNFKSPSVAAQTLFLVSLFLNKLKQRLQLMFTKEVWNVGIISKPIHECLQQGFTENIFWLPHPTHGIFADPFGYETNTSVKIIFENMDFKSGRGKLSLMEFDKKAAFSNGKTFLEKAKHLSYPYLFESASTLYMIPECCASNKLCLYEVNKNNFSVEKEIVLMEDVKVVDPSIIFYNNKWWLFCTLKSDKPDLKLYIYFSDTLTGGWQKHACNPVKVDIASSQPGGTIFFHNEKLYRPSQDSSYSYGDRIVVNEIMELTETTFSEKEVAVVSPRKFKNYKKGLHTLSAAGNFTLIDAKKVEMRINYNFFRKIFKKR